jgi:hypothetical protein
VFIYTQVKSEGFPVLKGPYLGQKAPGLKPILFAPDIISTLGHEGSSGFALNGKVFIFQRFIDRKCHTYIMRLKDGHWSLPELIPFWQLLIHNGDFVISPDDKTMFFQVKQEISGRLVSNIWQVQIHAKGWGQKSTLPAPINTLYDESFASEANNGNLYFFSRRPGGKGKSDLYMCVYQNGAYSKPLNLRELNTEFHEWDPYIAPDESYLIFCSTKPGGLGGDDFYVSFRDRNNQWTDALNMGDLINSPRSDNRPYVTNDGRYFFYSSSRRGNRDIYWVDAKIIGELKSKKLK